MPCATRCDALVLEAYEIEYLPGCEQCRINQVEVAGLPQPGDFALVDNP